MVATIAWLYDINVTVGGLSSAYLDNFIYCNTSPSILRYIRSKNGAVTDSPRYEDHTMTKAILVAALGLATFGCTDLAQNTPTHRWASAEDVSKAEYRQDHATCQAAANIDPATKALVTSSPEYQVYSKCMATNGYELTAYNEPR